MTGLVPSWVCFGAMERAVAGVNGVGRIEWLHHPNVGKYASPVERLGLTVRYRMRGPCGRYSRD